MATTYTTQLRLAKPTTGELFGTWGDVVNTGITSLVEEAIAGRVVVTHSDAADYTLTSNNGATDQARNMVLRITGTLTAARNVICPTQAKLYIIENATTNGYAVTLKTAAGTGVSVAAGKSALLRCDGTNVVAWVTPGTAGSLSSATTTIDVAGSTAPVAGYVLVATSPTTATWQAIAGGTVLTNVTNVFTKNQSVASVALTPGSTVAVDAALSNNFTLAIGANATFTLANPTNLSDGMVLNFELTQDATGGRVITWDTKYRFPGGSSTAVLSTAANAVDFVSCYYNATTEFLNCVLNKAFSH